MYSARSEDIYMNDEEIRTVKSLQDGGTYIVRFNENLSCKQVNMLLSELRLHLVGRNVRILPEMPQYFEFPHFFEIVGEPT